MEKIATINLKIYFETLVMDIWPFLTLTKIQINIHYFPKTDQFIMLYVSRLGV